ncbi:bacterial transcriptional activator domain-containing protein [Clavibacter sp. CT19]|uniref:AfsR/SARP family transcriptional regulator n=1 Tax=Clavibacter sp. CT19 TaxID=3018990 RepID=UPI0022EB8401|nr:bacterial transcriptional activator domain-containing protein [Clavibacter sp. CT19]MDA3803887.1 bacterial transcriptional activator domain-containing protein [Clavibacter sp. CT19]
MRRGRPVIRVDLLGGFRAAGLAPLADASHPPAPLATTTTTTTVGPPATALSDGTQRLIAALALRSRPADRGALAAELWPEARDGRAASSLRSAVARLGDAGREIVETTPGGLLLRADVRVDLRVARATAARLLEPRIVEPADADLAPDAVALFGSPLLPDWFDAWLEPAADEWRHLRVNALEAQSDALRVRGRLHEAASAARRAIEVDPLRETAQRCLIAVHLTAGNQSDALHAYGAYRARLEREVGLAPTAMLSDLIAGMHQRSRALDRTG